MTELELPPEICDSIIDELHDDRTALKTCSLISRMWVPRTRHWLFETDTFCVKGHNLSSFLSFLGANASIGSCIRHFRVSFQPSDIMRHPETIVQQVISRMPHLKELALERGYYEDPNAVRHASIRILRLYHCHLVSKTTLVAWLESLPQIEEIEFSGDTCPYIYPTPRESLRSVPLLHLTTLKFTSGPTMVPRVMRFISSSRGICLKTLHLGFFKPNSSWTWFEDVAPSLEHLEFRINALSPCKFECSPKSMVLISLQSVTCRWPSVRISTRWNSQFSRPCRA